LQHRFVEIFCFGVFAFQHQVISLHNFVLDTHLEAFGDQQSVGTSSISVGSRSRIRRDQGKSSQDRNADCKISFEIHVLLRIMLYDSFLDRFRARLPTAKAMQKTMEQKLVQY